MVRVSGLKGIFSQANVGLRGIVVFGCNSRLVDNRFFEAGFLQLHVFGGTIFLCKTDLLCPSIFRFRLGMQLYLILTVLRLKILCNTCPLGNSSSRILRKVCPTLVATFLLYGGLYQIISLFRFFFPELTGWDEVWGKMMCVSAVVEGFLVDWRCLIERFFII